MKYVKKPVQIEAFRLGHHDVPDWLREAKELGMITMVSDGLEIPTLEGTMKANLGDWIIKGVRNELYPCKHDIFEETYLPLL